MESVPHITLGWKKGGLWVGGCKVDPILVQSIYQISQRTQHPY